MHRSHLPILDPCKQPWDAMPGSRIRRHCEACDREVIDLSAMHAEAAIDALLARDGRACVRYRTTPDGHLRFAPTPPPRPAAALVATLLLTACAGWDSEPETTPPGELGMCTPEQEFAGACEPGDPPKSRPHDPRPPNVEPIDLDDPPPCDPSPATDRSPQDIPLDVPAKTDPVMVADDYEDDSLMGVIVSPRHELKEIKRATRRELRRERRARRRLLDE